MGCGYGRVSRRPECQVVSSKFLEVKLRYALYV